ncbi:hypothetical protein GCM10023238_14480 [Streptomyces heliomycini]
MDSLGLRDGEELYLRPRTEALPEVHIDDLVDGIADGMGRRPHGWSPQAGRRLLRGLAAATLALGIVLLALPGTAGWMRAVAASAAGLLLIAGAGSASRAVGDAGAGSVLGLMAAPYFAWRAGCCPAATWAAPTARPSWARDCWRRPRPAARARCSPWRRSGCTRRCSSARPASRRRARSAPP